MTLPETGFILTCRTSDFGDFDLRLNNFERVTLSRWGPAEVQRYLTQIVPEDRRRSPAEASELAKNEVLSNPLILRIASTLTARQAVG